MACIYNKINLTKLLTVTTESIITLSMTQHLKFDCLVTPENFAPNSVCLFSSSVPFLLEITLCIWNWHNAKLKARILQLHVIICYVMLRSEQLSPTLLKGWNLNAAKLIINVLISYAWTVTGSAMKLKLVAVGRKQCKQPKTLNMSQTTNSMHNTNSKRQLFAPFSAYHYQFCTSLYQYYRAQLPVFLVNLAIIVQT